MEYYGTPIEELRKSKLEHDRLVHWALKTQNVPGWQECPTFHHLWYMMGHPKAYDPKRKWASRGEVMRVLNVLRYEGDGYASRVDWEMCEAMWCEGWKGYSGLNDDIDKENPVYLLR